MFFCKSAEGNLIEDVCGRFLHSLLNDVGTIFINITYRLMIVILNHSTFSYVSSLLLSVNVDLNEYTKS